MPSKTAPTATRLPIGYGHIERTVRIVSRDRSDRNGSATQIPGQSMSDRILVINCGSSSVKYRLFDMTTERGLAGGECERIGEADSSLSCWTMEEKGKREETDHAITATDHREALSQIGKVLRGTRHLAENAHLRAVGHRVVHGGERFSSPVCIDATVLAELRSLNPLAPLHNPANLLGIDAAMGVLPEVPQVAVFDTAFHQTMSPYVYRYPLPEEWYVRYGVRRYGFHGTSHQYVAGRTADFLDKSGETLNLITLHLGNGASAAAIKGGRCIDTSMGFTPLEGLMMGTRSGDIDAAIPLYITQKANLNPQQVDAVLNHDSGLRGICGENDMRRIQLRAAAGDPAAQLALDMYCHRIRKYIGAYAAILGRVDALVFTAGIGENSPVVRRMVCSGLGNLGIKLDEDRNLADIDDLAEIQSSESHMRIFVIRTNEELEIARQALSCQNSTTDNRKDRPGHPASDRTSV